MLSGGRGLSEVYLALLRVVAEEDGSLRKELRPTKKQRDLEEVARQHLHRAGRNVCRERGGWEGGGEGGEEGEERGREGKSGRKGEKEGERVGGRERNIGSGKESRTGEREEKSGFHSSNCNELYHKSFLISLSGVCHFER